jgi:hypothetical protein
VALADALPARDRVWSSFDLERKLSHLDDLSDQASNCLAHVGFRPLPRRALAAEARLVAT